MKSNSIGTFFECFQCGLIVVGNINFMLIDIKCHSMKKFRFWRPNLSQWATIIQKKVAKRRFLKNLSLERCRHSCSNGMHDTVVSHHYWVKICNFCVVDFHLLACLCRHLFCYCRPGVCYRNPGYRTESKVPLRAM